MSNKCRKLYIAGKISGDNDYRAKFNQAKNKLKKLGYIVLNPAELPEGMKPADYMEICFSMIRCADVIAFLPDWKESSGATLEHAYCAYIGKKIMYQERGKRWSSRKLQSWP